MDYQDHKKNHTAVHESHGVHLCNKCGWPFPNPHPSAKHRRAHKKICGTIEGYKLIDPEGTGHLIVSDDEHLSDEDHKTPSPKILERSINETGSGGIGERSNRSEYEVFSDAVAEFPDGGCSLGIEDHFDDVKEPVSDVVIKNDTTTAQSYEKGVTAVIVAPPSISADSSQIQNTEVPGTNFSGGAKEAQDHVSSVAIGLIPKSVVDCRTEDSACEPSDDKGGSACDSIPIKLETQMDSVEDNKKNNADEKLTETDAKGIEETYLDRHPLDVVVLASDSAGEASGSVSKLVKIQDKTPDLAPASGGVQLKEECTDKVNDAQGIDSASSGNSVEGLYGKQEVNENVYVISVPDDVPVVDNAEIMIKGYKDHKGVKSPQFVNVDSLEIINDLRDSVPDDDPSSFCSSLLNEGTDIFAVDVPVVKDSLEQKGESSKPIVEELHNKEEAGVSQIAVSSVEYQSSEEKLQSLTDVTSIEMETSHTVQSPEEQLPHDHSNNSSIMSFLEHATKDLSDVCPMVRLVDTGDRQKSNLVSMDDTGNHEKARIERCDIAGNDNNTEGSCTETVRATSESAIILPDLEVNARSNLLGGDNAADQEEDKCEKYDVPGIENGQGDLRSDLVAENLSVKTRTTPESASDLHESHVVLETTIKASDRKLPEPECTHLDRVLDTQEDVKELESHGNDKVQVECIGQVSIAAESDDDRDAEAVQKSSEDHMMKEPQFCTLNTLATESDNGGDVQALQKSSEDHVTKEPQIPSLDTSSSIEKSTNVEDKHGRDFVVVASGNGSKSLPDEGDNNFVAQQLGTSAADLSIDSSSQTDSLEGHWGSVSVLSTLSDIPAIVDTEPLPMNGSQVSAETEKAGLKKPDVSLEGQHDDKSDIFEPPSFMTLVEPRSRGDQKAVASEIQTLQNMQQPKAASPQPGWFPSLTHVVNDSHGRKKNEEIIAKVANWSTGKQHTPLKSLLSEANVETKSKSPNAKENPAQMVQKDETKAKDNGAFATTVSSIMAHEAPIANKEWNSPARYPADIKREKRKVKGRPYWAQFVCCSSVN